MVRDFIKNNGITIYEPIMVFGIAALVFAGFAGGRMNDNFNKKPADSGSPKIQNARPSPSSVNNLHRGCLPNNQP